MCVFILYMYVIYVCMHICTIYICVCVFILHMYIIACTCKLTITFISHLLDGGRPPTVPWPSCSRLGGWAGGWEAFQLGNGGPLSVGSGCGKGPARPPESLK